LEFIFFEGVEEVATVNKLQVVFEEERILCVLYRKWFVSLLQSLYCFLLFIMIGVYFCQNFLFPFIMHTGTCKYDS
jgi:hypothetical protein